MGLEKAQSLALLPSIPFLWYSQQLNVSKRKSKLISKSYNPLPYFDLVDTKVHNIIQVVLT